MELKSNKFHAGYILECVKKILNKNNILGLSLKDILLQLSAFSVYSTFKFKNNRIPEFAVLSNIISRGLPTYAPLMVEDKLLKKYNLGQIIARKGEVKSEIGLEFDQIKDLIIRSIFIIDPGINHPERNDKPGNNQKDYDSKFEKIFINKTFPEHFDNSLLQLIGKQEKLSSILKDNKEKLISSYNKEFYRQRVDFIFDLPTSENHRDILVIEIDGNQHNKPNQKKLDQKRDKKIREKANGITVRIKTSEIDTKVGSEKIKKIDDFFNHPYIKSIIENYNNPIYKLENGRAALQLTLAPFGIARIHKVIVKSILSDVLKLDQEKWRIAIFERDISCGELALKSFKELSKNLINLTVDKKRLPIIEYKIYNISEFENAKLNDDVNEENFSDSIKPFDADLVIDISLLRRGIYTRLDENIINKLNCDKIVYIHSVKRLKTVRKILSANPIRYNTEKMNHNDEKWISCINKTDYNFSEISYINGNRGAILYFLHNIFRKERFRQGQLDILERTLNLKNVLGLLPTGAGKSLTYQLSGLLQPAITLVIDPLKSLMKDQHDSIKQIGIDNSTYINSSISTHQRKLRVELMGKGVYKFIYISPERMQIEEFRNTLNSMENIYFSYCVVDEVHCVSEWGHDFRTSYLKIGENARKFCTTRLPEIPLIGLTGTASYDVLSDIQRELDIKDEKSIVTPNTFSRDELEFQIVKADLSGDEIKKGYGAKNPDKEFKKITARKKNDKLISIIKKLPSQNWSNHNNDDNIVDFLNTDKEYNNSGLIFCPHKSWVFGVEKVYNNIISNFPELKKCSGIYHGGENLDEDLDKVQDEFKNDKLSLLVSTKAFGMGIDKPNIRFTVHFNMPQSIESFYQEAGRAGRDREKALCYILYTPNKVLDDKSNNRKVTVDFDLMHSFHENAFPGIKKEKTMIWELLNEITYPNEYKVDEINQKLDLYDLTGKNIKIKRWIGDFFIPAIGGHHKRIYINTDNYPETFGYIDLAKHKPFQLDKPENCPVPKDEAKNIVLKVNKKLHSIKPEGENFADWILGVKSKPPQEGIEKILEKHNKGKVVISFYNNAFDKIYAKLSKANVSWTREMISKAYNYSTTSKDFIKRLKNEYRKKTDEWPENLPQIFIINNYYRIRVREDTFKAVYRLSIIGVIDDYTVDYNSESITAEISKKTKEEYLDNIREYIKKYELSNSINEELDSIGKRDGESFLQQCCGFITEYIYKTIADKRYQAIESMEEAINRWFQEGEEAFYQEVATYFDSKYYRPLLNIMYEKGLEYSIVQQFIKEADNADKLNHLQGACVRLLEDNPDNWVLLLLRSYARLLIEGYDKELAIKDYRKGWKIFEGQNKLSIRELTKYISNFYKDVISRNKNLKPLLNNEITRFHLKWLKKYNREIIEVNNERNQ